MRVWRFVQALRSLRRHDIPLTRWNVRAMWIQSDPDWIVKRSIELTEDEWDEYLNLMSYL